MGSGSGFQSGKGPLIGFATRTEPSSRMWTPKNCSSKVFCRRGKAVKMRSCTVMVPLEQEPPPEASGYRKPFSLTAQHQLQEGADTFAPLGSSSLNQTTTSLLAPPAVQVTAPGIQLCHAYGRIRRKGF